VQRRDSGLGSQARPNVGTLPHVRLELPDMLDPSTSSPVSPAWSQCVFDNRFTRELPVDSESRNFPRQVRGACFSRVLPTPVSQPRLIAFSPEVADLLDLPVTAADDPHFAQVFAGNVLLPGMDPFASCYGGHQFGNWAGQLGDGRAINLGELVNRRGEHWTLQLKGAGPTPYSRTADGLAVLRSSLREFLCSEAMHHLGIPTTRALSLVLTGDQVVRDMFYDGNARPEPGAVVCRVARSFTRFGHFEILAARNEVGVLQNLMDFTLRSDFPHLGSPAPSVYVEWFHEVCRTTAEMIVHWMRVGFVHGVMNTDNMSILGLTIDYGPYGWLDNYDPNWTPNTTDAHGRRYRFGHQPQIAQWNLMQLANAVYPLIVQVEPLQEGLARFAEIFQQGWRTMMAQKLGLATFDLAKDMSLIEELLEVMERTETDMTIFFRRLADVPITSIARESAAGPAGMPPIPTSGPNPVVPALNQIPANLQEAFYGTSQSNSEHADRLGQWLRRYEARILRDGTTDQVRKARMNAVNPKYVLRNYLAQLAIDKAEQGDLSMIGQLHEVLRRPYDEQPEQETFAAKRPDWARHRAGCSMLSCSS